MKNPGSFEKIPKLFMNVDMQMAEEILCALCREHCVSLTGKEHRGRYKHNRFPKIGNGIFIKIYILNDVFSIFPAFFFFLVVVVVVEGGGGGGGGGFICTASLLISCNYLLLSRKPADPDKRDYSATCSKLCCGVIEDVTVVIKISFETIRYVDYDSVVTFNSRDTQYGHQIRYWWSWKPKGKPKLEYHSNVAISNAL